MNSFPRLLCLATLVTSAFAQTSAPPSVPADPYWTRGTTVPKGNRTPAPTSPAIQQDLQPRSDSSSSVLPTATVLRLKLNSSISTATARPGERFTATLTSPVEINGRMIIPSGSTVDCQIAKAHGARRFAGKPSISVKATGVRLPDGQELSFSASVVDTAKPHELDVDEEGSVRGASPNPLNKVETGALAGAGAVAGAVIAGPEGLLIGTASGAAIAAGHIIIKHRDLTLPTGTELIFELDAPATISSHSQMGGME